METLPSTSFALVICQSHCQSHVFMMVTKSLSLDDSNVTGLLCGIAPDAKFACPPRHWTIWAQAATDSAECCIMANTMIRARNVQSSTPRLSHFNISKLLYLLTMWSMFFLVQALGCQADGFEAPWVCPNVEQNTQKRHMAQSSGQDISQKNMSFAQNIAKQYGSLWHICHPKMNVPPKLEFFSKKCSELMLPLKPSFTYKPTKMFPFLPCNMFSFRIFSDLV